MTGNEEEMEGKSGDLKRAGHEGKCAETKGHSKKKWRDAGELRDAMSD